MNQEMRELLYEVCQLMKEIHNWIDQAGDDPDAMSNLFHNGPEGRVVSMLSDPVQRIEMLRIARYSMSTLIFHLLAMIDEKRELGNSNIIATLVLLKNGVPVDYPPMLHECFGTAMIELGFDETWYKLSL